VRRAAALAAAALLTACGGEAGSTHAPAGGATPPPAALFKDGLLYAAVKARLAGADIDSTTRVSVIVSDGVVTLRGAVKDAATKRSEVELVRRMRGVSWVNDELRVGRFGRSAAQAVSDVALTAAVESALVAQTGVNVTGIRVSAASGRVTLAGNASTGAIKSTLLDAARHTPGVRNVVDRIAVKQ
jgi:osmotically-inducible protein OsmY